MTDFRVFKKVGSMTMRSIANFLAVQALRYSIRALSNVCVGSLLAAH